MPSHRPSPWPRRFALAMATAIVGIIVCANLGLAEPAFVFFGRVPGADVTWHFVLYFLLSLAVMAWRTSRASARSQTWGTLLILALLVGLEELSQRWIPSRTFSVIDLWASYAGLVLGALSACLLPSRVDSEGAGSG